ncbi:3-oxoacyl-ACP synthase [Christiangramia sp. SM2212]|uniref:3-oxoacyl-ACP synthase n=1 Tax=Christiangramia sediminicola TaxID=3073267 RepID=A0ABU1EPM1_9FLAO|nr:3-oxoacyl-ACP synthase [Christiangramia sp. SM2212]MDR5590336.1 3-oxoacyl-ACP synthase [Christiangramia sp. SM2212]
MKQKLFIKKSVIIRESKVFRNKKLVFRNNEDLSLSKFLKSIYKDQELKYPKFFKMDALSKLGYLGVEILTSGNIQDKETALVFANSASSLETDSAYADSMKEFPSPSLFVYTLPNIMLGEISIRHQLRSENIFLVSEEFDGSLFIDYSRTLFQQGKVENVLCGWVNLHNNEYDVFLWEIALSGGTDFNEEELKKLYLPTHE